MGHLKDIANQTKVNTFPSSTFEIEGEPPASQCSEALIESTTGSTSTGPPKRCQEFAKFTGHDLTGDVCHIITNPGGNTGDFDILSNTDNQVNLLQDPGNGAPTAFYISNGGDLILTRDLASFAAFISAAGHPYTIKGGKLYTTIPSSVLQDACTILFAPLT